MVLFDADKEAVASAQCGVAMHPQRSRCRAKRLGFDKRAAETESFVFFTQPHQGCSRQGVEGATACLAAIALQPIDLAMQVKDCALTVRAAARLVRALRLNHCESLRLAVHLIKPLSEQRPLSQGKSGYLLHQPIECLDVQCYLLANSQFALRF